MLATFIVLPVAYSTVKICVILYGRYGRVRISWAAGLILVTVAYHYISLLQMVLVT